MKNFNDLNLIDVLLQNIAKAGLTEPTEIQNLAIPAMLGGRDVLGIAHTGTGKTAAFCLPIIQNLMSSRNKRNAKSPRVLILAPTRELSSQILETINLFSSGLDIKTTAIYGGVGQREQEEAIQDGIDIMVATPGRLIDLIGQRIVRLDAVEILVLDESDRMLDMGFIDEIQQIMSGMPSRKQTVMFSATMPKSMKKLSLNFLNDPILVQVTSGSTLAENIQQKLIFCKSPHKFQLLKKIINQENGLFLVFTTSKLHADQVAEYLLQNKIPTGSIHADKKQLERERHLANFKSRAIKVLVASDIAARGIDIEGVTHVINFDLPLSGETYIHRVGRTARAGESGKAISFCDDSEAHLLEKIKRVIKEELITERFEGRFEELNLNASIAKKKKAPTPGKSQEKTAYLDHSKRQRLVDGKPVHPGFRKTKRKRR